MNFELHYLAWMSRKFLFLLNPIAGTGKKSIVKRTIEQKAKERKLDYEIAHTHPSGDYSYLKSRIEIEKFTDIIIAGGDGTLSQVTGSLQGIDVNFGIIPCGSGNGLALAAGISKDPAKALEVIFSGKLHEVDAFSINEKFSCMLSGLGLDAQVAHDFAKQKRRGLASYIKHTVKNFFKARTYHFNISAADKKISTKAYFISIANSNQFGNQFTIAPKASLHDGLLDIVIVQKMSRWKLLPAIWQQLKHGDVKESRLNPKGIVYFQTKSLNIHNTENAPLHIDGDPADTAEQFSIRIIPSAFRLYQPA